MDSIVGKVMRPFAAVWRVIALTLVICATGGAWADPVAEWGPGNFPVSAAGSYDNMTATSGDYTISKNNGYNISTANYIQVAPSSVGGGWPVVISSTDLSALTVVVAFSLDEDASGSLVGLTTGRGANRFYAYLEDGAMYAGYNNGNSNKYGDLSTTVPTDGTIHYLVFAYGKTAGTQMFYDGVSKYKADGLKEGDYGGNSGNTSEITFGAQRGPQQIINGAKFHYVAVYDSKLGDSDAQAAYVRAFESINGTTRKVDVTADSAFDSLTGFTDLAGNAASWTAGNNLVVTVPAAAADTVTLTLPTGGLDAGSLLKLDVAEGKTLVLSGSLAATSVVVTGAGAVDFSAATVTGTVKGDGTVVYSGVVPTRGLGWTDASAWTGTVWVKNKSGVTGNDNASSGIQFNTIGNSNSKVKVSGVTGWLEAPVTVNPEVVLDDDTYDFAWKVSDGNSPQNNDTNKNRATTFTKLSGSGKLMTNNGDGKSAWPVVVVNDGSEFAGSIDTGTSGTCLEVAFLAANETFAETSYFAYFNARLRTIYVSAGSSVSIAAGKTWTAANGIAVKGTLTLAGTGSTISGTVTGSGTVVCNQVDLSGSGFDNASGWTGKVQIAGDNTIVPTTSFAQSSYGNASSTLEILSGAVALTTAMDLPGTVNVASGSTLFVTSGATSLSIVGTNSGTVNLGGASSLATLSLSDGIARGTVVYPSALTTLNLTLKENLADDKVVTFSVGNGITLTSANVTLYKPDGSLNNTAVATLSDDGHSVSVSYTPTVSGSAAWCAYEFETSDSTALKNTGSDTTSLSADDVFSAATSVDGDGKLYTYSHPYRSITYPSDGNWSVMVRCTVPKLAETLVVAFGKSSGIIGLASGENPDTEMRVVQTSGNSHYVTNGVMPVLNGTTAQHVYVFTVASNQTVKVYCDNELISTVVYPSRFSIENGLQIGSVFSGVPSNSGLKRCWKNDSNYSTLSEADQKAARIDSMRLYKTTLGPNAIAQLSEEFPAVKLFQVTIAGGDANVWDSLAWTGGDISTINAYSKAIITVEDDATLTLPSSITADELVINVASGKTLTLVEAAGGTTFTIGQSVRRPIEVNTGSVAFDASSTTLAFGIGGTGCVFVDAGKTISVASGGSLTKLAGSGTVTYASYGSLPSALSFDDWTGVVVLPSFEANGVNLNNYGTSGSTVALTGITSGWLGEYPSSSQSATIAPILRLDGNVTITGFSTSWAYTFAEITGTGNLSFAPSDNNPMSVAITKVAEGYSGTIRNTTDKTVTIGTLDREAGTPVTVGSKVLDTTSGVEVSALTLAGEATGIIPVYDTDGLYVKAASVTKNDTTTNYDTLSAAVTALGSDAGTLTLLMSTDSAITLAAGQTLVNGNLTTGGVTGPNGYEVVNNNGTYTLVDNTASTWAPGDESDNSWNTGANWSTGYKPTQYTSVTFPANEDGWTVGIPGHDGNEKCASMTLNGDVTFQRGGGDWAKLCVYGAISGNGTLTLNQTCIENDSGSVIEIPGPVAIVGSNDSAFLGANGWTIAGNLSVGGYFKTQIPITVTGNAEFAASGAKVETQSAITITGTTTLNGDFSRDTTYGDAQLTFGDVTVAEPTTITGAKPTTFSGTVTLALGATLTVPTATTTVSGAEFAPPSSYYTVKMETVDSTTVYSVEKKPGTIFSVY